MFEYPQTRCEDRLIPPYDRYFANELAELYFNAIGSSEEQRETELYLLFAVAEFVAETAGPGGWQGLDAEAFGEECSHLEERERAQTVNVVGGFYAWLAGEGAMCPARATKIIEGLSAVGIVA